MAAVGFLPLPIGAVPLPVVDAEAGSFAVSGKDVTFRRTGVSAADAGTYTLVGPALGFVVDQSQQSIRRILLVGSTSLRRFGYAMKTNFNITAGDTKSLVVTVKDATGSAVNIAGSSIKWQCARSFGKASDISKSTASALEIAITDGANGVFVIYLLPDDTEDLRGMFYHEAQVTFADSTISTVLLGEMKVDPSLIESTAT